ncbi:MAG: hypothetical protein ACYT04_26790 [Nostoc sp.]
MTLATVDNQAIAQAELNQYIEQQAEAIAPNVEFISPDGFYNWEALVNGQTIATIHYDSEHLTQRYVVSVGGTEIFRWNTQARAERYILTHYKQGTLPVAIPVVLEPLHTRSERATTIEVLEQHGDEFVVHNCENDHYYIVRPNHPNPKERCECADCHYRGVKCKHQIAVESFLGYQVEIMELIAA